MWYHFYFFHWCYSSNNIIVIILIFPFIIFTLFFTLLVPFSRIKICLKDKSFVRNFKFNMYIDFCTEIVLRNRKRSKCLFSYETLNNSPSKFIHISSILSHPQFFEFSLLCHVISSAIDRSTNTNSCFQNC